MLSSTYVLSSLASPFGNDTIPLMSEDFAKPTAASTPQASWRYEPQNSPPPSPFAVNEPTNTQAGSGPSKPATGGSRQPHITWTGSEFIAYQKSPLWLATVIGVSVLLAALSYIIVHDMILAVTTLMLGGLFCFAGIRKPHVLRYNIDHSGITIGDHFRSYDEFVSFSVYHEGAFVNVELLSAKRFMPPIGLYCAPENEAEILDTLSQYVPFQQHERTLTETLLGKIHL